MRILGIDPSLTCTGLALLRENNNELKLLNTTSLKTLPKSKKIKGNIIHHPIQERLYDFNIELKKLLYDFIPNLIVIEEPVVFHNSKGVINVSYLIGTIIMQSVNTVGTNNLLMLNPSTVKKVITGKGNADKELIKKCVSETYNFDLSGLNNDEVDAIAIAITGFKDFYKICDQNDHQNLKMEC
jgi:crossover junction endodeoxyribonuclease RuvC